LMTPKHIIIGLGNPIMSDDGIGPAVAQEVQARLPAFDLEVSCRSGLGVVDWLIGRETAVIIDSMVTGKYEPGRVVRIDPETDPPTRHWLGSHGSGLGEAMGIVRACGAALPSRVIVYGIEVEDPFSVGETISPRLAEKLGAIAEEIATDVMAELGSGDSGPE
jgi:hydrogenase maturation protease